MSRRERRMYRQARGQAVLRKGLLTLTTAVILAGLASHLPAAGDFTATPLAAPTATPVTSAFDETVTAREVTLPQDAWYAIQTGVYSSREAADGRANAYAERGAPGYVTEDGGKWRVFIACYGEKSDAEAVKDRLSTLQQVETHLHTWIMPEITLRLSGMAGQLDVAEAGLVLPAQAASFLRDAAAALDAGESSVESVHGSAAALGDRISLWAQTARERFVTPPELIAQILSFADAWPARQRKLLQAKDATELSAQLKLHAMTVFEDGSRMRKGMLNE